MNAQLGHPLRIGDSDRRAPGRGFWAMRDIPTVGWLVLTLVTAVAHRELPMPRWLMIHLLLLGAVTHAILVWSQYFSFALLRSSASVADRRAQNMRLLCANAGAVLVIGGVPARVWTLTAVGAALLVTAVLWHGVSLIRRSRHSMPGKFGRTLRFYIASAAMLAIGASVGAWLAWGVSIPGLAFAHALLNVLGWIGLTVAGTVVSLWPTILRTRADEFAPRGAARALPAMAGGVLVAASGAAAALLWLVVVGLLGYLAGLVVLGVSLWRAARQATPKTFAALSVGVALVWWAGCVAVIVGGTVLAIFGGAALGAVTALVSATVPFLAAGFAAQVLVGALSYLVPVVLGGGPTPVRIGAAVFDRAARWRVAVANTALVVCALPLPTVMRTAASLVYLGAMASFLVLMVVAMRAQRRAKAGGPQSSKPKPMQIRQAPDATQAQAPD